MEHRKEHLKKKFSKLWNIIQEFIKKWTKLETWKDSFIPENPTEHPRLVRFLFLTFVLTIILIGIVFIISFSIARMAIPTVRVPSVTQMDITEAIAVLQSSDLQVHFEMVYDDNLDRYQVISQYPSQGSSVRKGRNISLIISLGQDRYTVPELCGLNKEEALNLLSQERIPYAIQVVPAGDTEINKVIAMSTPIGSTVPRDTILSFTVTDAILVDQYRMDNFIRQPLEFAANTLFNNRITPILVTTNVESLSDDGLVLAQNVREGVILQKNTSAILTVGLYAYNEGDKNNLKWHFFNFSIPKVEGFNQQIIITNEDGTLEDLSIGEQQTAKFYKALLEDELGRTRTIYERMGAEGTSFNRVFKAYGKAKVYVYANEDIIGSRNYGE
ncbi:MAG: PASTA domain-containing protein [Brevinema sp.]